LANIKPESNIDYVNNVNYSFIVIFYKELFMIKKILSFLLTLTIVFALSGVSLAATAANEPDPQYLSTILYQLGLFRGTGTNSDGTPKFELERGLTRSEAITMLVRLLGEESYALSETYETPFTDVEDWAKPYVGYAYEMGLTNGTSASSFGGKDTVTANQYITFVLRALGYTSGREFSWETPWTLSDPLGLTKGQYNAISKFLRADTAIISYNALAQTNKNNSTPLLKSLVDGGAVTAEAVKATYMEHLLREKVMDAPELIAKTHPAIFSITSYDQSGAALSSASGFFISSGGIAVTSYHIVKNAASVKIKTFGGNVYNVVGVYDFSESEDIALIQVAGSGFDALEEAVSGAVSNSSNAFALYYPPDTSVSIAKGEQSPNIEINSVTYFKTGIKLPDECTGGPIINSYGKVIGIAVYNPQNLAIPASSVDKLKIDRLTYFDKDTDYKDLASVPDFGAYFGFAPLAVNSQSEYSMYLYNMASVISAEPNALSKYKALLEAKGFVYHGTFDGPETSGHLYMSEDMTLLLYFGSIKAEGSELILVAAFSGGGIFPS
jgi:hypothetical protein